MAITITAPAPAAAPYHDEYSDSSSEDGGVDLQGDIDMRPAKRARHSVIEVVTPGQTVTDDPQWMRYTLTPTR